MYNGKVIIKNNKMKNNKKFIFVFIILTSIVSFFLFFNKKNNDFQLIKAEKTNIVEEIFETGTIKKGENLNLAFKNGGKINKINISEGKKVKKQEILATLEINDLMIRLNLAKSNLSIAEINYNKLISGAAKQDIEIIETSIENVKKDLNSAILNLEKIEKSSAERKNKIYGDAFSLLNDAHLKSNTSYETIDELSKKYFSSFSTEDTKKAIQAKDRIKFNSIEIKKNRDDLKKINAFENFKNNLDEVESYLKSIFNNIEIFRSVFDEPGFKETPKQDLDSIINEKNIINQLINSVISLNNNFSITESSSEIEINNAKSQIVSIQGKIDSLSLELVKIESPADENDLNLAKVKIEQAQSEIKIIQELINNSKIIAPTDGTVSLINLREGEIAQPGLAVLTLIPEKPFQVEINIYEADIGKIKIGNECKIELVAFPNEILNGEIVFIDSASKIVDGIVYYRVLIDIKDYFKNLMFGMSVDVTVITEKKENVLAVPESYLIKEKSDFYVKVLNGDEIEKRLVKVGLFGSNEMVEIISGINENDNIILE